MTPRRSAPHNPSQKFDARFRLRKRSEFQLVQNNAQRVPAKHVLILLAPAANEWSRLGITVTKKIDSRATRRNTIKRRLREIFRRHKDRLRKPFDIVMIARQGACECPYHDLEHEILRALQKFQALVTE